MTRDMAYSSLKFVCLHRYQSWASECPDVKNYKWLLNPVWHKMLYSLTHTVTVGVKGLSSVCEMQSRWLARSTAVVCKRIAKRNSWDLALSWDHCYVTWQTRDRRTDGR